MEGKVSTDGAQKVFDRMPGSPPDVVQQEEVPNCILRVVIHEVIYPMTNEVLHLVFDLYGGEKGVHMMILEKVDHVLAFVVFPSPHEATRAREALHGRNIYDGCCRMDIKYLTPPPVRNTTVTAPTPASTQPMPCSAPTCKAVNLGDQGVTAMVRDHAGPLHHSVALAAATTSQKLSPTDESLGANQVLDRMPVASDDKELVQVEVKKEQLGVPGVFDGTHERVTSEMKLCRFVKWVSRVRITRRRVRWTLRSKYRNSTTAPSPPPVPPHPPDQPVHSLDPCSAPQAPAPPHTPDPLPGIGPLPWPSFQHANISEGSSKHMLAVKPPEGRGSVGPEDLIVPVCWIEQEYISAPVHIALWCLCHEQILRSASTHGLYTPTALEIIHRVTQSTTRTWNPGIMHTIIHSSLELFALRAPLMYGLRVELEGVQAMLVSLVELKLEPSWKRTLQVLQLLRCFGDFTSFGQYSVQPTQTNSISLFIMSASLICLEWSFMLWDPGNLLRFLHLISSDNQNFGEDNVLELDHEQNTDVLGVIPGILLLLHGPHGLDLSTVRETPGVYVVDIMLASAYSKVVDTQVQWDPGDFLPSMDDGYDLHQAGQGSAFAADSYGTSFRPHLPDDQSELNTWDPGGVCRSGLRTSQNLSQDAHEFTKTCVQLTLSDLPPFLPLLPECWYCTMTEVTRKYMGSAAKSSCLVQSDDTYLDNHCLINSSFPSSELTINKITCFHGLTQEDNAEPLCYREQGATYGQVELILAVKVTLSHLETDYSRIWLNSAIISVHPYMPCKLGISLAVYLQYRQWDPGIMELVLMHPIWSCPSRLRRIWRTSWHGRAIA